MEKDVIISIKGTQKYDGGEPGAVELVTAGRLAQDEAGYTLSYQESELTGLEGRRHLSMYNTPYGAMAIGVNTRHLLAELDDHGGNIEIDYCIEVDHAVASRNIFCIQFKEAEGSGSLKQ